MTDLSANGIVRDWRIGVGNMASEHFALRFRATRLGAIRRFNAMVRSKPDLAVELRFVVDAETGATASKPYRFAEAVSRCNSHVEADSDDQSSTACVLCGEVLA